MNTQEVGLALIIFAAAIFSGYFVKRSITNLHYPRTAGALVFGAFVGATAFFGLLNGYLLGLYIFLMVIALFFTVWIDLEYASDYEIPDQNLEYDNDAEDQEFEDYEDEETRANKLYVVSDQEAD